MNAVSVIILAVIIVAVIFAIRYTVKHGTCDQKSMGECGGSCGSCPYHEMEMRAALKNKKK